MPDYTLFLTLNTFSLTGGLEKVCRSVSKVLYDNSLMGDCGFDVYSMHDTIIDANVNLYIPTERFKGFGGGRIRFILNSFIKGRGAKNIIISHINLLPVAWLIKLFSPRTRLIMFAHGIEIWGIPLGLKKKMLYACDQILCVSYFTKKRVKELYSIPENKLEVLNNCLDPFLPSINTINRLPQIRNRYGIKSDSKVIFTLTRLNSNERYKGYDRVVEAISLLKNEFPELRYVIGGCYDLEEKKYLDEIIERLGLKGSIIFSGFIPDSDLPAHFRMADIYIMPSTQEGFGLVFIEAMYYGIPVIAGNSDGSVDALLEGALGSLVDPMNINEIKNAIKNILTNIKNTKPDYKLLMNHFSFENYKKKLNLYY